MSTTTNGSNSNDNKKRVQVGNLDQPEKELKNHEAESVKGGGGAMGGVDYRRGSISSVGRPIGEEIPSIRHIGEEIPQKNRS